MSTILILDAGQEDIRDLAEFLHLRLNIQDLKILATDDIKVAEQLIVDCEINLMIINISSLHRPHVNGDGLATITKADNIGTIIISPFLSELRHSAQCQKTAHAWVLKDGTFESLRKIFRCARYLLLRKRRSSVTAQLY